MKHVATICLIMLSLIACKSTTSTDALKARIATLEERVMQLESQLQQQQSVIPMGSGNIAEPSQAVIKSSSSTQCQGITKKGRQCSRSGKHGGYCYQHVK